MSPSRRHRPGCCLWGLSRGIPDSETEVGIGGMFSISLPTSGQFCMSNEREKEKGSSFFSLFWVNVLCTISLSCSQRHLSDYLSASHSAEQLDQDTTEPGTMSRFQPALLLWQRSGSSLSSGAWIFMTLRLSQWATAWGEGILWVHRGRMVQPLTFPVKQGFTSSSSNPSAQILQDICLIKIIWLEFVNSLGSWFWQI